MSSLPWWEGLKEGDKMALSLFIGYKVVINLISEQDTKISRVLVPGLFFSIQDLGSKCR